MQMPRVAALLIGAISTACFIAVATATNAVQPARKNHQHEAEAIPAGNVEPVIEYCTHCSAWRWSAKAPACRSRKWRLDPSILGEFELPIPSDPQP